MRPCRCQIPWNASNPWRIMPLWRDGNLKLAMRQPLNLGQKEIKLMVDMMSWSSFMYKDEYKIVHVYSCWWYSANACQCPWCSKTHFSVLYHQRGTNHIFFQGNFCRYPRGGSLVVVSGRWLVDDDWWLMDWMTRGILCGSSEFKEGWPGWQLVHSSRRNGLG